MTPRHFEGRQFGKGTLDFSLEFNQLLQNDFCKQRYITLNASIFGLRQKFTKIRSVQNFFAGYIKIPNIFFRILLNLQFVGFVVFCVKFSYISIESYFSGVT